MADLTDTTLESLEVGASAVVRHFLQRLHLQELFERFLPAAPTGAPAKLSCAATLTALVGHLLLCHQPLYALGDWFARRVPEHLGLEPQQVGLLNDDRIGRAAEQLFEADCASLLTALVLHTVCEFRIDVSQFHNDSTSLTLCGEYANQAEPSFQERPPLITKGYSKDHRPDLKQLLYCVTVSSDGAVPMHFKTCDGNTTDDQTHQHTWLALKDLVGHANFLYVADCKLCSHENLDFIAEKKGRFLTVLPRTWKEAGWMEQYVRQHKEPFSEVRRERSRRGRNKPDMVYEGFEYPDKTEGGYRLLCYRSSQKRENDAARRARKLQEFRQWHESYRVSRRKRFDSEEKAQDYGRRRLQEKRVQDWVQVRVEKYQQTHKKQVGAGRPGPDTKYEIREESWYEAAFEEDKHKQQAVAKSDGLFYMITNDKILSLSEVLGKYKYQPFLEKRFEQLKTVFEVMPVWLKKPERIAGLLFVYFVVLLVQALLEREVRLKMKENQIKSLPLYPEGRETKKPTAELVLAAFDGLRRHRLCDNQGRLLRTFHDPLSDVARQLLVLLGIDAAPFTAP